MIRVYGDIMLDRWIVGEANRMSPEAPVPVVKHEEAVTVLGMSENVKRNLQSFGVHVTHITIRKLIKRINNNANFL